MLSGVAVDELELSLSTAWRHRRSQAEDIAHQEIVGFVDQVEASGQPIVVQFDEKELEEDIAGKVGLNCCHLKCSSSIPGHQEKSTGCTALFPLAGP